jgi:hypothetical protein
MIMSSVEQNGNKLRKEKKFERKKKESKIP